MLDNVIDSLVPEIWTTEADRNLDLVVNLDLEASRADTEADP